MSNPRSGADVALGGLWQEVLRDVPVAACSGEHGRTRNNWGNYGCNQEKCGFTQEKKIDDETWVDQFVMHQRQKHWQYRYQS